MMSRKMVFYVLFFALLVVGFFIVLTRVIPGFANSRFPPVGYVESFSFIDQDGRNFTQKDVAGKTYVAHYFFTTCKGICPRMNNNMRKVYDKFQKEPGFMILSHTSDPEVDSVKKLKRYADSMGVSTERWVFLTGRKDSLYNMARLSYKIDDPANNLKDTKGDFLHTQYFALVTSTGEVKKVYDGLKESELARMIKDIEKLLKE